MYFLYRPPMNSLGPVMTLVHDDIDGSIQEVKNSN